jgi:hypothetical protein
VNSARRASGTRPSRLAFFNSASPDCRGKGFAHRQRNRQRPPQGIQRGRLQRRDKSPSDSPSTRSASRTPPGRAVDRVVMPTTVDRNRGRVPMPGDRSSTAAGASGLASRGA